ncbi:FHIPEP family type III secretion protein, partial [Vibrio cholerae]|nr:FHIPEP family type III secretion protein [Vibrio cholerae]
AKESEVIKNEVDAAIGLNRVHDVLKEMIRSPEFYLDRVSFFEALIYWSRTENEPKNWLTRIRNQAKYEITSRLMNEDNKIHVALLDPLLTELIESFVAGEIEDIDQLIDLQCSLRNEVLRLTRLNGNKPILMVNDNEITSVKAFFQKVMSTLPICSHSDIADSTYVASSEVLQIKV